MSTNFVGFNEELRKRIRTDLNDLADYLAAGGCKDFSEYKRVTGKIEGLAVAERHLLDLIEAAEKANN
jgi:hypothetical protein